jgi:hypothetical protein
MSIAVLATAVSWRHPPASLALWALVPALLAGGEPAAWLLGAAAVVAVALPSRLGLAAALPGAAALAIVIVDDGSVPVLVVGAAVALSAGLLVARPEGPRSRDVRRRDVAALLVGAWLLVAPTTWTWVGRPRLDDWTLSMASVGAAAVAAVWTLTGSGLTFQTAVPWPPTIEVSPPSGPVGATGRRGAAAAALGIAVTASMLLVSVRG